MNEKRSFEDTGFFGAQVPMSPKDASEFTTSEGIAGFTAHLKSRFGSVLAA